MDGILPDGRLYIFSTWLFLRGLGLIYAIAFFSFLVQVKGLIGRDGISPVEGFLERVKVVLGLRGYLVYPTLGWLASGDGFWVGACIAGAAFGMLLALGVNSTLILIVLWVLYLSLINAGQEYLSYQWDVLLVEAGFLAIFLSPPELFGFRLSGVPATIPILLLRLLIFRLIFMSGILKWVSRDPTWRHLTALGYHYETQPLPTPLSFPFKWAPRAFNRFSTAAAIFIEIFPPFFFFAPWSLRIAAAAVTVGLQVLIELTGNFAFFNLLTILLVFPLLDDRFWDSFLPASVVDLAHPVGTTAAWSNWILIPVGVVIGGVGILMVLWRIFGLGRIRSLLNPLIQVVVAFRLVNPYGLFVSMTTQRPEIILEGSQDGEKWEAYEFKYKAGDPRRAPRYIAPHQPRLDWQMWFAALGGPDESPWFLHLVERILEGSPAVLRLMKTNPFPNGSPRYLRALLFDYRFTTPEEKKESGAWWKREELGEFLPPVSIRTDE